MKANRKVMLGAALVVAVIALAGVGYAAFAGPFKAVTVNDGNAITPGYIRADQENYTAIFTKELELNTYTSSSEKVYVLKNSTQEIATDVHGELLGSKQITINATTITPATLKLTSFEVKGNLPAGWSYYLTIDNVNFVNITSFSEVTIANPTAATTVNVSLYIAGADFGTERGVDGWADLGSLVSADPVASATSVSVVMTFTATPTAA